MKVNGVTTVTAGLYHDVMKGLSKKQKELPSKYFYDERGSDLFEQICQLEEYYPTDCEIEIMQRYIDEIVHCIGRNVQLVELGSGSSMKTRLLLRHCRDLAIYVPVDISGSFLIEASEKLRQEFENLDIRPVTADYTSVFEIPKAKSAEKCVIYYPGSTIGNFTSEKARDFLTSLGQNLTTGDGLLIGVDLEKDTDIIEAAYNDSKGITSEFNKNILRRLNRELDADFDQLSFRHLAFYNHKKNRIEMHLESLKSQDVKIDGQLVSFKKGETIHTENSHKYTIERFDEIAGALFRRRRTWTDEKKYFSVHYFERV